MRRTKSAIGMHVQSVAETEELMLLIRRSASRVREWIAGYKGDPLEMLEQMKFESIGFHPTEGYALNIVEQINQTWTYAVAISAAKQLLALHPDVGGFHLAPGAHASLELDVMSDAEGMVGAETCAVVDPRNNGKLRRDVEKLSARTEQFRYAFFLCPKYPGNERRHQFEQKGVQVWSVEI